ncbi:MAG: dockerin type I repeat-containing protein, partial [Aeriscardovia sp.]|nr:dockerin type I repeat-containing protein [Aeriscardovia sp.]
MKQNYMTRMAAAALLAVCSLPMNAQLSGTGFYRFRNAERTGEYISLANDKFNYSTAIGTACGGLTQALSSAGQARALECAGKFLETDIHMVADADCIDPGSVVYAKKRNTNASNYDYNLIGQGTSLLTLTTGTYPGSIKLQFDNRYVTIEKVSNTTGTSTLYTAMIELASSTSVPLYGKPSLGTRYLVDDGGKLAINESNSATNAKWYIEPVTHFNVSPQVEFGGKYYTTLYVPYAFKLSGQVLNAYVVTAINADGTLELETVATAGGTVPAGTPVLLECGSNVTADCQLIPTGAPLFTAPDPSLTTGAPAASTATNYTGTNLLKGNYYCNTDGTMTFSTSSGTSSFNANNFTAPTNPQKYVVGITASGKLGFVKATGTAMPANKAWLEYTGTAELVLPFETETTVLGDVNCDGDVTIADVTALVNIILGKATEGDSNDYDFKAANVNGDDGITIADVTALVN